MRVVVASEGFYGFRVSKSRYMVSLFRPAKWCLCKVCDMCKHLTLPLSGCYCRFRSAEQLTLEEK